MQGSQQHNAENQQARERVVERDEWVVAQQPVQPGMDDQEQVEPDLKIAVR
jgi:hypothetical protein